MKWTIASDINTRLFILDSGHDGPSLVEECPHEVLSSPFLLELIFAYLHPRTLCAAVRVNITWYEVAYAQRALWRDWNLEECLNSAQPRNALAARFGRLRRMVVPASFVKSHGTPTHCVGCCKPFPICNCENLRDTVKEDIDDYFRETFSELRSLSLSIPPHSFIDPFSLSLYTSLTSLSLENLNPACTGTYGALITQCPHLRALTYLTRPFETVDNPQFSFSSLMLEHLEVNQIDFEDIVHMASSLKTLKIAGYAPIDKYMGQVCIRSIESITLFSELESLDISGLDPREVANPSWVSTHVCMLSNLQKLDVGPLFGVEDFARMSHDMVSLRAVGITNNPRFHSIDLQEFTTTHLSSTLTSLSLRNCIAALAEPECLASFTALRTLHIEQDPPHARPLRKLVPTVMRMTQLEDLALVGLSINPVVIYPKLPNLQRLVLNRTPTSDADVLIISKKLPALRHLGLVGCYHVSLCGLLSLLAVLPLRVLEWDEPAHTHRLVNAQPELCIIAPRLTESLELLSL